MSVSLISQFLKEVEPIPPGGVSGDSCWYQISVSKEQDTIFVTFKGKNLNSYGDSKLSGTDGFQQSLLKSLYRSLRDKRKLICEDYGTLLEECGGVVVQDIPKKVTIPKVEPKVVEIPKKLQEPVAQKTEGDKTVCEKVCEGLVAYFSFNGNTKDVTGNNNEGKIVGAKLTKDKHGKINNAYMFNGKNYIKLETNNLYNNDNSFSISIISNTIGFSDKYKYSSRAGSSYTSQELLINSNRTVHLELFYFSDGGRNIGFYVGEKTVWGGLTSINDYHHIVVIADGLNKEIKIYLDGKIKETKKWSNTSVSGKNDWILGGNFGERGYIGVIDEIRFYDKALTTEEVRNIYINYF